MILFVKQTKPKPSQHPARGGTLKGRAECFSYNNHRLYGSFNPAKTPKKLPTKK